MHLLYPGIGLHRAMPRQSRLDGPNALHHVMVPGIERTAIFWDDADEPTFRKPVPDSIEERSA